ncbi:MAG: hypothetical protein KC910_02780 [Candidatus Eremiobacteraeota bacterium]|nr:hypothetical protein [Candidatus Eremiobacteraeota bacterium]
MTQHYAFVHRILPDLVFSDPATARRLLEEPTLLRRLWVHAGMHTSPSRQPPPPLSFSHHQDGLHVLVLPPPAEPPEAHFVALRFTTDPPGFYTLELGEDALHGGVSNYLCGWDGNRRHSNYGSGIAAEVPAFCQALVTIF